MSKPHVHDWSCGREDTTCPNVLDYRAKAPACGATTVVPSLVVTAVCELPHGHDGPHHGHIDDGLTSKEARSPHLIGPRSYDWAGREPC